jgi:hypothetical protein
MSAREQLPNRRDSDRFTFWHDGFQYIATYSRYPDGRMAEVFFSVAKAKSGTAIEAVARDAAVLASLCLQHGVSEEALRHSLTRLDNNEPAGPVCRFLDVLAVREEEQPA